jgi:hypothetical protein
MNWRNEVNQASPQIFGAVAGQADMAKSLSASQYDACRENAQAIVKGQLKKHEGEAAAWRWLDAAMVAHPMTTEEEAGLWDLLSRARRERF